MICGSMGIDKERQNVPDVPEIYFVQSVQSNVERIIVDASRGQGCLIGRVREQRRR
jgi:hypothetical protein